jgi:hypothetical protein
MFGMVSQCLIYGQAFLSQVVNAVRNRPYWKDSIIFITYDEHGGFYDHARPPRAPQGGTRTPDGIAPGQCAYLLNPPASLKPGGGAQCSPDQVDPAGNSVVTAEELDALHDGARGRVARWRR